MIFCASVACSGKCGCRAMSSLAWRSAQRCALGAKLSGAVELARREISAALKHVDQRDVVY